MFKNAFVLIGLVLTSCSNYKSTKCSNFTVQGEVLGMEKGNLHFTHQKDGLVKTDTIKVENGKFVYEGNIQEPELFYLNYGLVNAGNNPPIMLFFEPTQMKLKLDATNLNFLELTNSKSQNEYEEYKNLDIPYRLKADSILKLAEKYGNDKSRMVELQNAFSVIDGEESEFIHAFVQKHPNSYVAPYLISGKFLRMGDFEAANRSFEILEGKVKKSNIAKQIVTALTAWNNTKIGSTAPDFTATLIDGKSISLKTLRGKYVLIDFWASWCGPCRAENPNVVNVYNQFKDKNFEILAISLDDNKENWVNAVRSDKLNWLHVSDLKGWTSEYALLYGIQSIPDNFLIDPQGKIIAKKLKGQELVDTLKQYL